MHIILKKYKKLQFPFTVFKLIIKKVEPFELARFEVIDFITDILPDFYIFCVSRSIRLCFIVFNSEPTRSICLF